MENKYDFFKNILSQGSFPLEENKDFTVDNNQEILDFLDSINVLNDFDWDDGATKFVLIPKAEDINYVIKIPYSGDIVADWDEDGRLFETFYPFSMANNGPRPWDYCATECLRYQEAEKANFNQYLAKTELLGFYRGYPIYAQEKCVVFYDKKTVGYYSLKTRQSTFSKVRNFMAPQDINLDWLTDFRFCYGAEALSNFMNFINKNCWDDDLRETNIGYLNNKPVLIDYSGFLE